MNPVQAVGRMLIPNQRRYVDPEVANLLDQEALGVVAVYEGQKLDVTTSMGHALEAFHFAGKHPHTQTKVDPTTQTVVLFGGQGCYQHYLSYYIDMYTRRGINVVTFNYTGVGRSDGETNPREVVDGGVAIVDHLERHFNVPLDKIALHGFSLGGGISAQVALIKEGVHIVNDRSYAKLSIAAHQQIRSVLPAAGIARRIINSLAVVENMSHVAFKLTGWELDTESAWSRIRGRKCVICHTHDPVIVYDASLYKAIHGINQETTFMLLEDQTADPHSRPLTNREIDAVIQAIGFRNLLAQRIQDPVTLPSPINLHRKVTWLERVKGAFDFFQQKVLAAFSYTMVFLRSVWHRPTI